MDYQVHLFGILLFFILNPTTISLNDILDWCKCNINKLI